MSKKIEILIVEDEKSIREGLADVLRYHGYSVSAVDNGEEGLRRARSENFALVVLDVMLPSMSGFEVCQSLRRERAQQAVLMLTAKGSEEDIVEGFQNGADDYVTKPFSIRELLVRVEALLRRSGGAPPLTPLVFGDWTIDPATLRATTRASSDEGEGGSDDDIEPLDIVELTPRELRLVSVFVRERGRVVSRRSLLKEVWEMSSVDEVETRTVDMNIAKLRKKLDPEGLSLFTVRGAGYRYEG